MANIHKLVSNVCVTAWGRPAAEAEAGLLLSPSGAAMPPHEQVGVPDQALSSDGGDACVDLMVRARPDKASLVQIWKRQSGGPAIPDASMAVPGVPAYPAAEGSLRPGAGRRGAGTRAACSGEPIEWC